MTISQRAFSSRAAATYLAAPPRLTALLTNSTAALWFSRANPPGSPRAFSSAAFQCCRVALFASLWAAALPAAATIISQLFVVGMPRPVLPCGSAVGCNACKYILRPVTAPGYNTTIVAHVAAFYVVVHLSQYKSEHRHLHPSLCLSLLRRFGLTTDVIHLPLYVTRWRRFCHSTAMALKTTPPALLCSRWHDPTPCCGR